MKEDIVLIRRMLINRLVESGVRLLDLSRDFPRGAFGATLRDLGHERTELWHMVLREMPDPALTAALDQRVPSTAEEVIRQEVELAATQGEPAAAHYVVEAERALATLVGDLPAEAIGVALRNEILRSIKHSIQEIESSGGAFISTALVTGNALGFQFRKPRERPPGRLFDLWFGTNRTPTFEKEALIGFSGDFSEQITFGRCAVAIPKTHRIGEIEPSWWSRVLRGAKPLEIARLSAANGESFWEGIRQRLQEQGASSSDAVIFLHGFNVSFDAAALCAAQIGADLNLPGVMAFYSWPSRGKVLAYAADEASIEASEAQITQFLEDFGRQSGARRIHLIAHSMGNRGLLRAVNRIAANAAAGSGKSFGQIILAAPDVDARVFHSLAAAYAATAERTTLYVSSRDLAVRSSRIIHDAPRVGYFPPVSIVKDIDTVSVTNVDLSFLGHGYVASCRTVLTDMHQLLMSHLAPSSRAGLRPCASDAGDYWEIAT